MATHNQHVKVLRHFALHENRLPSKYKVEYHYGVPLCAISSEESKSSNKQPKTRRVLSDWHGSVMMTHHRAQWQLRCWCHVEKGSVLLASPPATSGCAFPSQLIEELQWVWQTSVETCLQKCRLLTELWRSCPLPAVHRC